MRSVLAEPRAPDPPARQWWDWALVAVLLISAVAESIFGPDVAWRPLATVVALLVIPVLLWRRTHPLLATAIGFGGALILHLPTMVSDVSEVGLNAMLGIIVLPYALYRWGSGRDALIGTAIIAVPAGLGLAASQNVGDRIGGTTVLVAACALGAAMRYRAVAHKREVQQVRTSERGELARELHDTVAHHVSAIAIQAQAGRAVAATDPATALQTLAEIEAEASRTLSEMRTMVQVLREGGDAVDYEPQRGIGDLDELTRMSPLVRVQRAGDLADLPQPVEVTVYRICSGVGHQRHPACPSRDPGHRRRHRRCRPGTADHRRRRLRRRRPRPSRLRPDGHAGTRLAARRHLPCRPGRAGLAGGGGPAQNGDATMSIRVLIADDQPIVRSGLAMILDAQPDIDVVGAAADGREAVRLALQLRPDVGLFDIRMPLMDGIEATRRLAGPDVADPLPIVVITTFDLDEYVHGALKAGARGFLLKDAGAALLTQAIHAAADGDALIAPSVTVRLLAAFAHLQTSAPQQPMEPLTAREEEVLIPVAQGRTNNEIASELFITPSTVKAHVASLMRKLGARNRVEVAMWAHETGRI